ncbi:MAG: plasmid pRiA4b ORF-3 family protein [Lewinellaceae bacterium]|nr:plasmid pRiA4b ORF-3 family protein [Lewinellaceae bacterium]
MENILQFKITLKEIRPLIWRRIQVTDDYRFGRFHQVIQIAMGWWNYHLHEFHIKGWEIGMPDDDPLSSSW